MGSRLALGDSMADGQTVGLQGCLTGARAADSGQDRTGLDAIDGS